MAMPVALDVLCDRVRALREGREEVERAAIVFVSDVDTGLHGRFRARIRVDGRSAGEVVGPKGRTVLVEPGVHFIRVRFSTRTGFESEKRATVCRSIDVGPGDRLVLTCGMDLEAVRALRDHRAQVSRSDFLQLLGVCAVMGLALLVWPALREAVAWLTIRLGLDGTALHLVSWPVQSRPHAACFVSLVFYVLAWPSGPRRWRRELLELRARYPSPFYVGPKTKQPLAGDELGP
jgi:hypothetical protein